MNRRKFLKILGIGGAAATIAPAISLSKPQTKEEVKSIIKTSPNIQSDEFTYATAASLYDFYHPTDWK